MIEENKQFHCAWQKVQNILGRDQSDVRKIIKPVLQNLRNIIIMK